MVADIRVEVTYLKDDISAMCVAEKDQNLICGMNWGQIQIFPLKSESRDPVFILGALIPGVHHVKTIAWSGIRS